MLKNRLRSIRKAQKKTQQEVASHIGVIQSTYSYWESGKVRIDNESFCRLAEYFGVSMDFLQGRKYRLARPFQTWDDDEKEDYNNANQYEKEYLEYLYGKPVYVKGTQDEEDDELEEYLYHLKNRPEMRMLFSLTKGATKEDVEKAVKIIEALRGDPNG